MNVVRIFAAAGAFAEDKDVARELRLDEILPPLRRGEQLVLDFRNVNNVTQSFMHACISEALRLGGRETLARIEFKACNEVIRTVIETVVEYSIRAFELARAPTPAMLLPIDVPQADNLAFVRRVIDSISMGDSTPEDIVMTTNFSLRHVHYRMHAGRILGFVEVMGRNLVGPTPAAHKLRATQHGGSNEIAMFDQAIRRSKIMRALAPDLLGNREPLKGELAQRLEKRANLSRATAVRRAQCLLAWRRYLLEAQLPLPNT